MADVLERLERIVRVALETNLESVRRPEQGSVADTYVLDLASDPSRAVCKLGGTNVWTGDVIEPHVLEVVAERTDLPVPTVLVSGSLAGVDDALDRWALYEYCEGRNPRADYSALEPPVRRQLVADAGKLLGRLHATFSGEFDRVGGLERVSDGCRLGSGSLGPSLRLCEPAGWHAVDSDVGPFLEDLPLPRPLTDDDARDHVLTHGDYGPGNLLIADDGTVTAVLDWGNAHVTHSGYALARAEARFVDVHRRLSRRERSRLRQAFREGYARVASLEAGFDRYAPVYKLLWICQSIANYARIARSGRGRKQLWRQCRRLRAASQISFHVR
ncbi:phosphotransferase family protein [Natronobacterium texcoconense]|uniref:phosphotransferase family protein n=1 Tax=Natronobacterium texcoconense TaxID=1095778 RepID=UPI001FCD7D8E|nr:phosphotransferase [Natronobacterium texcoconense]